MFNKKKINQYPFLHNKKPWPSLQSSRELLHADNEPDIGDKTHIHNLYFQGRLHKSEMYVYCLM